jgi:hypothetical protein
LFAHIASAFFLFAGLAVESTLISFLRRNPDLAPFPAWSRLFSIAPRLYGPSLGVLLLSGGYLGAQMSSWGQGWIRVSFVTLFVVGLLGATLTAPRAPFANSSPKPPIAHSPSSKRASRIPCC